MDLGDPGGRCNDEDRVSIARSSGPGYPARQLHLHRFLAAVSTEDPTLRVIESEFAIFGGRPQHRATYDTGRKAHDGTGADSEPTVRRRRTAGSGRKNRLIADWTDEGLDVRFQDPT